MKTPACRSAAKILQKLQRIVKLVWSLRANTGIYFWWGWITDIVNRTFYSISTQKYYYCYYYDCFYQWYERYNTLYSCTLFVRIAREQLVEFLLFQKSLDFAFWICVWHFLCKRTRLISYSIEPDTRHNRRAIGTLVHVTPVPCFCWWAEIICAVLATVIGILLK